MPLSITALDNGRYAVKIAGVDMELRDQLPFARVSGQLVPLAAAPFVFDGHLHVPFEVVAELLPRVAADHLRYNAARAELRFTGEAAPSTVALIPASDATAKRAAPSRPGTRAHRRRIVVDAGHGGVDNGMSGPIGARGRSTRRTSRSPSRRSSTRLFARAASTSR